MSDVPSDASLVATPVALNPNEAWRNFTKRASIAACKLKREDLKFLYRLIDEKQAECRDHIVGQLSQMDGETPEQYEQRRTLVKNAFITTLLITGQNGQVVAGHGEAMFDSPLVPERIDSVLFDTAVSPKAQLNHNPPDQASVLLDFSRPPLINFANTPSEPTPNNSNWTVSGETESWSTSLSSRLAEFFSERATPTDWLHRTATYDLLLLLGGLPLSLWGAFRLGSTITGNRNIPTALTIGIYVYAFFLCANVFRALFSYSRWVFPKLELESPKSSVLKHRLFWSAVVLAVLGSAAWDAIKLAAG